MNLIICSLDTLRAAHLSCLGNERGLTPNLDRIASEGSLFSQTYATDIPTQPSHTALFTGSRRGSSRTSTRPPTCRRRPCGCRHCSGATGTSPGPSTISSP